MYSIGIARRQLKCGPETNDEYEAERIDRVELHLRLQSFDPLFNGLCSVSVVL